MGLGRHCDSCGGLVFRHTMIALMVVATLSACTSAADAKKGTVAEGWTELFHGKDLGKWQVVEKYDFKQHGEVHVRDGRMVLESGKPGTAVRWTGDVPRRDFELSLEAMRVEGNDFFCGITFPVGTKALTLVLGGWGGQVCGLSSVDGEPAVENETCCYVEFEQGRWYRIRLKVTDPRIEVWLDQEKIIDLDTQDRDFSIYWEMEPCLPLGIATWRTTGALRQIRVRSPTPKPAEAPRVDARDD